MIKHDKKFLIDFLGLHPLFRSEKKAPTITNPVLELKKLKKKQKIVKSARYTKAESL